MEERDVIDKAAHIFKSFFDLPSEVQWEDRIESIFKSNRPPIDMEDTKAGVRIVADLPGTLRSRLI